MIKIIKMYILQCISAFVIFFGLDFIIDGSVNVFGNIRIALIMAVIGTLIVKLVDNNRKSDAAAK